VKILNTMLVPLVFFISGCASNDRVTGYSEIGDAWRSLESSDDITDKLLDDAVEKILPFLQSEDPGLVLTMALIFRERALSENIKGNESRRNDYLCYLAMLRRSSDFGDLGAASTLSSEYHFGSKFLEGDKENAICWRNVVDGAVKSQQCITPKNEFLTVCRQ
jgi:hypothetical protein